ncbi:asparagine synthase-related protein [Murinocardiopsis flavida]|uniref:asparagine synthase-related protein n=1 Tax=Murinocardiopsis flavida TaxID=645275 RepID=UPI001474C905|nr:asparagine synthase C-terminal domain-containing protein [Murinocardiopsis flavida]
MADVELLLLGQHDCSAAELREHAAGIRTHADLAGVAAAVPGCYHLIASVAGRTHVHGTLLGHRPVFRADVRGTAVAADRADVLAALSGSGIDESHLASHLIFPPALHPLTEEPVWHGVHSVPFGHSLVLEPDGGARCVRRWSPPVARLNAEEGAHRLREALSAAVSVRAREGRHVSCDLAGLDSTAICCLALRRGAQVTAFTAENPDPADDDLQWAERTLAGLSGARHEIIPAADMPLFYEGLHERDDVLDGPCPSESNRARHIALTRPPARSGAQVHLNGFGGDEILRGSFAHLRSLVRRRPRAALSGMRGFRTKYRWTARAMARQLLDRRSYSAWLADTAARLDDGHSLSSTTPLLGWGAQPSLMPWMTPLTRDLVRDRIHASLPVEPLSPLHGQHTDLAMMVAGARDARHYDQIARRVGIATASPFYDDHVVDAALSIDPWERITPWRFKPILQEAMRGIVPDGSLRRSTKAHWTSSQQQGLRRHRNGILEIFDDSRLAALGLVDAGALRDACLRSQSDHVHPGALDTTIACENWLRSSESARLTI